VNNTFAFVMGGLGAALTYLVLLNKCREDQSSLCMEQQRGKSGNPSIERLEADSFGAGREFNIFL